MNTKDFFDTIINDVTTRGWSIPTSITMKIDDSLKTSFYISHDNGTYTISYDVMDSYIVYKSLAYIHWMIKKPKPLRPMPFYHSWLEFNRGFTTPNEAEIQNTIWLNYFSSRLAWFSCSDISPIRDQIIDHVSTNTLSNTQSINVLSEIMGLVDGCAFSSRENLKKIYESIHMPWSTPNLRQAWENNRNIWNSYSLPNNFA